MMSRAFSFWTVGLLVALVARAGAAQSPRPEDVATIDGIIRAYYEVVSGPAGAAPDTARDRSLHHPKAWIAIASANAASGPAVRVIPLAEAIPAAAELIAGQVRGRLVVDVNA